MALTFPLVAFASKSCAEDPLGRVRIAALCPGWMHARVIRSGVGDDCIPYRLNGLGKRWCFRLPFVWHERPEAPDSAILPVVVCICCSSHEAALGPF